MPQKRMIHEKLWENFQYVSLTPSEKLLYIGLIVGADDEGCFRADAGYWKRKVFYDSRIGKKKVQIMLEKIEEIGLIITGETIKGFAGCHPKWHTYQKLRKDISKPSEYVELLVTHGLPIRFTPVPEYNLTKEKKIETNTDQERVDGLNSTKTILDNWDNHPTHLDKPPDDRF